MKKFLLLAAAVAGGVFVKKKMDASRQRAGPLAAGHRPGRQGLTARAPPLVPASTGPWRNW